MGVWEKVRGMEMEISLTPEQKHFIQGLRLFGCSNIEMLVMVLEMWHPDDLDEMLNYMVEHPDSTPAELSKACSRISARRPHPEDEE